MRYTCIRLHKKILNIRIEDLKKGEIYRKFKVDIDARLCTGRKYDIVR